MEWIWERICSKDKDGNELLEWTLQDIEEMYHNGFVNFEKYSKDQWVEAFHSSRQKKGSYQITKKDWLKKTPFRYNGRVQTPFDPMTIKEGPWKPEELKKLIKTKIYPRTTVSEKIFEDMLENAKKLGKFVDDHFVLTKAFKISIKNFFVNYPSPLYRRELLFLEAKQKTRKKQTDAMFKPTISKIESSFVIANKPAEKTLPGHLNKLIAGKKK
ncbi:MAG: hypothetical protein A3I75_00415 [Deltaproteobacteria bacterium RIFCSPLOWO2_02_FULL_50_16]|nr:MAG: hypothetical protein A3B79_05610 [Deltaproteobacteria bacterium RIFCSPHIGHO2_02_FULL_50_15]OGQ58510.1 MAG: hypothetical protein A3I75_00415 [Deltaproteobacteria bacterium RIFCSPLOWO2_02_FULL_50_16]OGQ67966.1 MAG: hypothetical protein A3F89_03565 [Deltaproteobacteria bacterium RIFCSPLOWO2_12_FULL_50_11]